MKIYLIRHALALDRSEWHKADAERPLTDDGVKKMKKAAKGLRNMGFTFSWILTSPVRRAHDTALIVADEFKARQKLRILRSLAPDGDTKALVRHLALDFRSWESVLLIGHEPYLSNLISTLIGGESKLEVDFKKGALCKLSSDSLTFGRCATLEWLVPPKILRQLA